VVWAGRLRKLWYFLSELHSSVCERRLERTILRPALLPVKTAQFTQFLCQVWRHTVKSFSLTESVERPFSTNGAVHCIRVVSYKVETKRGADRRDLQGTVVPRATTGAPVGNARRSYSLACMRCCLRNTV